MFYLVVETADQPGGYGTVWRKVGGGLHLVDSPFTLNLCAIPCYKIECCFVNDMCQLKNDGERKPEAHIHGEKEYQPRLPPHYQDGNRHIESKVKDLGCPEDDVIGGGHF